MPQEVKGDLKQRIIGLLFGRISSTIRGSIDSLFISIFLGLEMVAVYSNYFYVVNSVAAIIIVLESSLVAGVGNSLVTETKEKNYKDFLKFTFYLQWIVGWCSICVLCLEQSFMEIWVGTEYMLKDHMVFLCAIYLFVNCICLIRSVYTQALGMWWQLRRLSVIDVFVNVFLNYFMGKTFGPYGILGATILDICLVSIPWTTYFLFRDYFGLEKYREYILLYIKYFLVMVVTGTITWCICHAIGLYYCNIIIYGVICILIPNIVYYVLFRNNTHFRELKANFNRVLLKK